MSWSRAKHEASTATATGHAAGSALACYVAVPSFFKHPVESERHFDRVRAVIGCSLSCFAILLLAGCVTSPVPLRPLPLPQAFTVAGRSDKTACIKLRTGLVEDDDTYVYLPGVGSTPATSLPVPSPGVLNFGYFDQSIFAIVLSDNLQRLKLFREAMTAASLLRDHKEVNLSTGAAGELQRDIDRLRAYPDCLDANIRALKPLDGSELPEARTAPSTNVMLSLAFHRTRYLAGADGYQLEVEMCIDGGREPLHRSYHIDSAEGLSWWQQMSKGAGGKQRAAAILMERLLADIDRWVVAEASVPAARDAQPTRESGILQEDRT